MTATIMCVTRLKQHLMSKVESFFFFSGFIEVLLRVVDAHVVFAGYIEEEEAVMWCM